MQHLPMDEEWTLRAGSASLMDEITGPFRGVSSRTVSLPDDYLIREPVSPSAPAGPSGGFYTAAQKHYTKHLTIPESWKNEKVFLSFDGVMGLAVLEVNGDPVCTHQNGYAPFRADITEKLYPGADNRISVTVHPGFLPDSRWYAGAGLFRSVELLHGPALFLVPDGIRVITRRLEGVVPGADGAPDLAAEAFLRISVEAENASLGDHYVRIDVTVSEDAEFSAGNHAGTGTTGHASQVIRVPGTGRACASMQMVLENVALWDADHPGMYRLSAHLTDLGSGTTRCTPPNGGRGARDEEQIMFGIRTVTTDVRHGLRINGRTVKLQGGCLHHDNGLLGAISLEDAEVRRLRTLKKSGFNAVRTSHNPPSAAFLRAADRVGIYVLEEFYDAWTMAKKPGDGSVGFPYLWKESMEAVVRRDANHPSVILWSIGNEIPERGGLGGGEQLSAMLLKHLRALDATRPVTNALCSFWNGLDDAETLGVLKEMMEKNGVLSGELFPQVAAAGSAPDWGEKTEAFANGLDVVGYNYMHQRYAGDHAAFPQRVLLGTESYGKDIPEIWAMISSMPFVIGDFAWTAWDYLGEAGIGRSEYVRPDDPRLAHGSYGMLELEGAYPWRLGNCGDFDINGSRRPQGALRAIVWGSGETALYTQHPAHREDTEVVTDWGWPRLLATWNYAGYEGVPVTVVVYSAADEVEIVKDGMSLGRSPAGAAAGYRAVFQIPWSPGCLEARSLTDGAVVSTARIQTTGPAAAIRLLPEQTQMDADIHSLCWCRVEAVDADGRLVPEAATGVRVSVEGAASLAAAGSGNPRTEDDYTGGGFHLYEGAGMVILRGAGSAGETVVTVCAEGMEDAVCRIKTGKENEKGERTES